MMNMSFDQLREEVNPAATMVPPAQMTMQMIGSSSMGGRHPSLEHRTNRPRSLMMADHPQELSVYFFGPGAESASRARGVELLDAKSAASACKGKRDFILFEPLDGAVKEGKRLVIVAPLGAGRAALTGGAQAYLANSIASWLGEEKTDGAGRPYGETKDEDPTLRKHFTREQMQAIRAFGALDDK